MSFDAAQISFLEDNKESISVITTLDMFFRDETFTVSDSLVPRTIGGTLYQNLGGVLSASAIQRQGGFQSSEVTYKLHAEVGPLALAIDTDSAQYKNRDCIRRVQLYAAGVEVGSPITLHTGFMDSARWRVSGSEEFAEIVVRGRFSKRIASPRYYTDADQRSRYANDKAFQYMASFKRGVNLAGWLFS